MSKLSWLRHMAELGFYPPSAGGDSETWRTAKREHSPTCAQCKARVRTRAANANRRERDDVMRSCGLVKVRGSVSGRTYWE